MRGRDLCNAWKFPKIKKKKKTIDPFGFMGSRQKKPIR